MWAWQSVSDHQVALLFAVVCLLVVGSAISSRGRGTGKWKHQDSTGSHDGPHVPTLEGAELYYDRVRWPVYEPRFNLRLSSLHGPVVCVKFGSKSILAVLLWWLNNFLGSGNTHAPHAPDTTTTTTTILINSLAEDDGTLKDLLNSCTSRGPSIAAGKYLSRGRRIVLMPYGPEWTRHRKAFASLLTRDKVKNLWAKALRYEAMVLVDRLANLCSDHHHHHHHPLEGASDAKLLVEEVSRFTASTVLQIAYGRRAATPQDPLLSDLEVVSRNIASAFQPGRYWVESFPLLDLFPAFLSPWKRQLNADHEFEHALFEGLLRDVEKSLGDSSSSTSSSSSRCKAQDPRNPEMVVPVEQCAAARLLRSQDCHGLDRDAVAYLAAGLFEAGTETTAMTINAFLLGAACCPEYTRRAQAELDGLLSSSSSKYGNQKTVPDFQNLEALPLLSAYVKEALRLTPAGASGVGHTRALAGPHSFDLRNNNNNNNNGKEPKRLDMPSGATVLANIYGLHHDSKTFPDPWRFNPGRWLSPPAKSAGEGCRKTLDHTHACYAFGFGRRICPGSTLACYSLTMAIALLLLCFDFTFTDNARKISAEMQDQNENEYAGWERLFGDGAREVVERERASRDTRHLGPEEAMGSMLIDAHIAFKLSRTQVGECVRLVRREDGIGLGVVRDTLATLRGGEGIRCGDEYCLG